MSLVTENAALDELWDTVRDFCGTWIERLDLSWCSVHVVRVDACHEDQNTVAITHSKWQYRDATISVFLPALLGTEPDEIESTIVHELVHVLIDPMESCVRAGSGEKTTSRCELAVENITRALISVSQHA